jgi:hypothetical protein
MSTKNAVLNQTAENILLVDGHTVDFGHREFKNLHPFRLPISHTLQAIEWQRRIAPHFVFQGALAFARRWRTLHRFEEDRCDHSSLIVLGEEITATVALDFVRFLDKAGGSQLESPRLGGELHAEFLRRGGVLREAAGRAKHYERKTENHVSHRSSGLSDYVRQASGATRDGPKEHLIST